jgi:outer membrane immunogenic protein
MIFHERGVADAARDGKDAMRFVTAAGFGIALSIGLGLAPSPVAAADLDFGPLRGSQGWNAQPVVRWQGAYFGGYAGYSAANSGLSPDPARDQRDDTTYGVFAGYNFQFENTVLGIEADMTLGEVSESTATLSGYSFSNWGTLRARAGYTIGAFMPFVTAGLVVVGSEIGSNAQHGLTAGAGVDVALTENIFLRGEWQYFAVYRLEGAGTEGADRRGDASVNTVRGAVGVKF